MQRGWKAKGLLKPLWQRYEGGRDALAGAVGTTGSTLSSINTGDRNLGPSLAHRLAAELNVSVLELGAPDEEADGPGLLILDRLAELEEGLNRLGGDLPRLGRRVSALERRVPPKKRRAGS